MKLTTVLSTASLLFTHSEAQKTTIYPANSDNCTEGDGLFNFPWKADVSVGHSFSHTGDSRANTDKWTYAGITVWRQDSFIQLEAPVQRGVTVLVICGTYNQFYSCKAGNTYKWVNYPCLAGIKMVNIVTRKP